MTGRQARGKRGELGTVNFIPGVREALRKEWYLRWMLQGNGLEPRKETAAPLKTWRQDCSARLVKQQTARLEFSAAALSTGGFSAKQKMISSQGG